MRFITFEKKGQARAGVLTGKDASEFIDVSVAAPQLPDTVAQIASDANALAEVKKLIAGNAPRAPLAGVKFLPVIPAPSKIVCLGLNYADHAKEGGNARPEYPSFFLRGASSMIGHNAPIIRPKVSTKLDYEAELAVVIGKRARHLTKDNALDAVSGYACFNDATLRDYQRKTTQWTIGKNFDGTGPFGPWLVTPDELPPGAHGLSVQSKLNGKVMQDGNTQDFLWGVAESLAIITECLTLEPGDVVITGTPAGVGYARTPPVWMAPGDVIEIVIDGVGTLSNPIADEA
jgi:2-keto-4-pentenoate hydratase/2-oxohepta-3-ene-1,7-dioic acid hydratase in catechol pathway